jgi:hypothetical protein
MEKMHALSGVYEFDAINSSCPAWYKEELLDSLEPPDAQTGCINRAMTNFMSSEASKLTLQSTPGATGFNPFLFSTWTRQFKDAMMKLTQLHFTFDLKRDTVPTFSTHVRLKLPKFAGGLRTPWMKMGFWSLDGTPVDLTTRSKQIRMFAMQHPDGQLRILVMHFRMHSATPNLVHAHDTDPAQVLELQCCHTRELCVSSRGFSSTGELLNSANEAFYAFHSHYNQTECVDPALISTLLDEDDDEAPGSCT